MTTYPFRIIALSRRFAGLVDILFVYSPVITASPAIIISSLS
jgi:hypothetical protein